MLLNFSTDTQLTLGNEMTDFLKNDINHRLVSFRKCKKTNVTQLLGSLLYTFPKYKIELSLLSVMDHLSNEDHDERWVAVTSYALPREPKEYLDSLRTEFLKQKPKVDIVTDNYPENTSCHLSLT